MSSIKGRRYWRSNYKHLMGSKVGMLRILRWDETDHEDGRRRFVCLCDCGNESVTRGEYLVSGRTQSCGCKSKISGNKHRDWNGVGEIPGTVYSNIKRSAKKRNYEFSIGLKFLWELYLKQDRKCKLSKIPITFRVGKIKGNASLDRIDNKIGYTESNVRWVDVNVNLIKRTLSDEELFEYCKQILKTNNKI